MTAALGTCLHSRAISLCELGSVVSFAKHKWRMTNNALDFAELDHLIDHLRALNRAFRRDVPRRRRATLPALREPPRLGWALPLGLVLAAALLVSCLFSGCGADAPGGCAPHGGQLFQRTYSNAGGNCPPAAALNGAGVQYPADATSTECTVVTTWDHAVETADWAEDGRSATGTVEYAPGNTWCPAGGTLTFTQHISGGG